MASYRDTFRLLLAYATRQLARQPTDLVPPAPLMIPLASASWGATSESDGTPNQNNGLLRPYVDAPRLASMTLKQLTAFGSGTVVCPASWCSSHRLRARMVFVDRIQIAYAGSRTLRTKLVFPTPSL